MVSLNQAWQDMQRTLTFRKLLTWSLFVVLILGLIFAVRSCRSTAKVPEYYLLGEDSGWYPLQLHGHENTLTAFSNDVLFSIVRREGLKIELSSTSYQRLIEMLDANQYQGVLTAVTPEFSLQEQYLFSDPYYLFGAVIVLPKDSNIDSLNDLNGKAIAVRRGSSVLFNLPIAPLSIITPFDSPTIVLDSLIRNKTDAVIMDQFTARFFLDGFYSDKLKMVNLPMKLEGLRLMTRKDAVGEALIAKFNAGLKKIKEDGTYRDFLEKWDLSYSE